MNVKTCWEDEEGNHSVPYLFIQQVNCLFMSINVMIRSMFKKTIDSLFAFFESYFYERPLNLVILAVSISVSINIYFSTVQMVKGGFIETDMWFFAYRIEEMADHGIKNLFTTPYGFIDIHPPLYYLITVPLRKTGVSVLWIAALLRFITPVTVIYLVYRIGDSLFGKQAAAVSCFFIALMPPSGSYHGLWTSTPITVSLIPFLAGVYGVVKFSESRGSTWIFWSVLLFFLASLTHLFTAVASFIFMGCTLFFFRKSISRLFILVVLVILAIITVYGWNFFSVLGESTSLIDVLRSAFGSPSSQKASMLRQFFFIAYWPRHFTLIASVSFCGTLFHFYARKSPMRVVDKIFFVWMIALTVYSQLFLVGIYLSNQRFLLFLLFSIGMYGGYGFVKEIMPALKNHTFLKFSFFTSILLFSVYPVGIALAYYPTTIRSDDVTSCEELSSIIPEGTLYVQNWFHNGRYLFAFITDHPHIIWDVQVNRQIGSIDSNTYSVCVSSGVEYLVVVSEARAQVYLSSMKGNISLLWTDGRFYLLAVYS